MGHVGAFVFTLANHALLNAHRLVRRWLMVAASLDAEAFCSVSPARCAGPSLTCAERFGVQAIGASSGDVVAPPCCPG
jgi:hypothetical protein